MYGSRRHGFCCRTCPSRLSRPHTFCQTDQQGVTQMFFTYRWFLLNFKREFDLPSVLVLWEVCGAHSLACMPPRESRKSDPNCHVADLVDRLPDSTFSRVCGLGDSSNLSRKTAKRPPIGERHIRGMGAAGGMRYRCRASLTAIPLLQFVSGLAMRMDVSVILKLAKGYALYRCVLDNETLCP